VTDEFLKSIHYNGSGFRDIVDWPQGTPANLEPVPGWFGSVRVEGETDRFVFGDINTVVNAFHYRNLVLMSKIASVLGNTADQAFFSERSELVKASFNEKLMNKDTGLYTDGEGIDHSSLHANMFPVAFGLAPVENYPRLKHFLISKEMACSPYGAPYLFDALYELGAHDYALELLTSESDRSWMNMIRFGTTITSEAWDIKFKRNMTWNHAWGASPVYIITRRIFGIEPLEPAFSKILIRPRPGSLESASIKSPTIKGAVHAKFNRAPNGEFTMEVEIPANTTARLMLPVPSWEEFTFTINGIDTPLIIEDGCVLADNLESGRHTLKISAATGTLSHYSSKSELK
jgi:alpha-L-rhamnosidase